MITAKSASWATDVLRVKVSLAVSTSFSVSAVTAAVLLIVSVPAAAEAPAVTTTVRVSEAPETKAPTVHVGSENVVNPLGVEAQMMSGTIDGLSTAMNLEITVKDGRIEQTNFPNYPVMRMAQAPDVEVHILNTGFRPSGAGEMGIPTAAPALTNAIFAATGQRIRRLPIARQLG